MGEERAPDRVRSLCLCYKPPPSIMLQNNLSYALDSPFLQNTVGTVISALCGSIGHEGSEETGNGRPTESHRSPVGPAGGSLCAIIWEGKPTSKSLQRAT